MTIHCIVFDLGGVLVDWNPRHLYKKLIRDEAEREWFLANVCTTPWHVQHDAGVSYSETTAAKIKEFPEHEALIRAWDERWAEFFNGPLHDTVALLEQLAPRFPVFALTNWSGEKFPLAREMFPFFSHFRDIVVSGDEKVIKPEKAIFDILVRRTGYSPAETLLVDDSIKNVEAAQALGFHVHHFKTASDLEAELVRLKLIQR